MNAEKITNEVMDRIMPWLGVESDLPKIHYAILRSHDSVISGLSPAQTDGTPPAGVPLCGQYVRPQPCMLIKGHDGPCGEDQQPTPSAIDAPRTEVGVPLPIRQELVRFAEETGKSYYYLCSIYLQGKHDGAPDVLAIENRPARRL